MCAKPSKLSNLLKFEYVNVLIFFEISTVTWSGKKPASPYSTGKSLVKSIDHRLCK